MTVIFCLFMLLVAVVLLNALIAILGDSYDRVRERSKAEKIHAKLDLTVDLLAQTRIAFGWVGPTLDVLQKIYTISYRTSMFDDYISVSYDDWDDVLWEHWSGPLAFIGEELPIESASDALKFVVRVLQALLLYLALLVTDIYHIVVGIPLLALRRASPVLFLWNELDDIVPAVAMPVRVYEAEVDDTGDDEWDGQIKKIKKNTQAIVLDTETKLDARMSRLEESLARRMDESMARRVDESVARHVDESVARHVEESVARHVGALREALLADRQPPPAPAQ